MAGGGLRWAAKRAYLEALRFLPDRMAISADYFRVFGSFPKLDEPKRFSEKIQHMKLHMRDPRMPALVDKVLVKDHVAAVLGPDWVIPTLWRGGEVTEEVLRAAPRPAVMKPNHSSAQVIFLDEDTDAEHAVRRANRWLKFDYHLMHREWAYGQVARQVLIEPFVGEGGVAPPDYKFWVFDGEVRFIQVDHGRFEQHTRQFYDPRWTRLNLNMNYPSSPAPAPAPKHLKDMLEGAAVLAEGFRFVRVDFYDAARGPLFGEMTFAPEAGLCRFEPRDFDWTLGESWAYPRAVSGGQSLAAPFDTIRALAQHREP
ncbi:MAG: ATP-grasp fold amidoligase family protein [Hyphomonadaceae bacterium]